MRTKVWIRGLKGLAVAGLVVALVSCAGDGQVGSKQQATGGPNRYMVKMKTPAAEAVLKAAGAQVALKLQDIGVVAAYIPDVALPGLMNNPNIEYIEEDQKVYPLSTDVVVPGAQTTPYGITMVQADQVTQGSATTTVCIIDSGYYTGHTDLSNDPTRVDGTDTTDTAGNTLVWNQDGSGHGTHVAGTISALTNSEGVVGIAPLNGKTKDGQTGGVKLHIVRVFGDDGTWAYTSGVIQAAYLCRDAGAKVISMSLGRSCYPAQKCSSQSEEAGFNDLYAQGILSVAAASNDGDTTYSFPASYDSVVSVAAVDSNKAHADFSNSNDAVELSAPGVAVLSTVPFISDAHVTAGSATAEGHAVEGAATTDENGVSGTLVNGGLCDSIGSWTGAVVLCARGEISFNDKVANVNLGGGVAAVISNNVAGELHATLGDGVTPTIPAIGVTQDAGTALSAELGNSATVVNNLEIPASGYEAWDGTSMATPHVAGVAALVWSHNGSWTNTQIRAALQATAEDLGPAGKDNDFGYGLIRAKAALDSLSCGNGTVDAGEQCDGSVGTATCVTLGYVTGSLSCAADCTFDTSGCTNCGNGNVDAGEQCDGSVVAATCQSLGYYTGSLSCAADCTFDTSGCTNCGNGTCGADEDATSCPGDCYCGNGTCDAGETETSCSDDCSNPDCAVEGESCDKTTPCCAGYSCQPKGKSGNYGCVLDDGGCTPTETTETSCDDGVDNDCDGAIDSADSDCNGGSCLPKGADCTAPGSVCCSGQCHPAKGTCK